VLLNPRLTHLPDEQLHDMLHSAPAKRHSHFLVLQEDRLVHVQHGLDALSSSTSKALFAVPVKICQEGATIILLHLLHIFLMVVVQSDSSSGVSLGMKFESEKSEVFMSFFHFVSI
jgi:hypothetical protein